ncbi:hypothetical protein pdam_00016659, partial [Pocillopora damicornis]
MSVSVNEVPWMNNSLKCLICRRQKALTNNNLAEYNQLQNKVNRDQKACRAKCYNAKSSVPAPSQTFNTLLMRGKILNTWPMQAETDKFQLIETKCEELQISFSRSADSYKAVTINNKPIQVVTNVKLLGLTISNNHKWNAHIENVIKKRFSRFYQLRQLKHAKEDPAQLVCFFSTCILPVSEYACQVFHNGLPNYQAALKKCNIATLYQWCQSLTERQSSEIKDNTCHKLHGLLSSCNLSTMALRRKRTFNVPFCRTNRLKNSFIMYHSSVVEVRKGKREVLGHKKEPISPKEKSNMKLQGGASHGTPVPFTPALF